MQRKQKRSTPSSSSSGGGRSSVFFILVCFLIAGILTLVFYDYRSNQYGYVRNISNNFMSAHSNSNDKREDGIEDLATVLFGEDVKKNPERLQKLLKDFETQGSTGFTAANTQAQKDSHGQPDEPLLSEVQHSKLIEPKRATIVTKIDTFLKKPDGGSQPSTKGKVAKIATRSESKHFVNKSVIDGVILEKLAWRDFVAIPQQVFEESSQFSLANEADFYQCPKSVVSAMASPMMSSEKFEWCKWTLRDDGGKVKV